jgi:uncharacterized protein (TIGR02569 family)
VPTGDRGDPPPLDVLAAFGASGDAVALSGGRRTVWRVGGVVLKPLDCDPETLAWQESLLNRVDGHPEFRVAPPLRSRPGELVVDGWTAWRFEAGRPAAGRWLDIIATGDAFHRAVADVPRPRWMDERVDPWAVADRVAWRETPATAYLDVPPVREIVPLLRPLQAPAQLIHGDLAGNVLFADGRAPVILDLSPYWRPPVTAAAIVVVDALLREGAGPPLVDAVGDRPDFPQYFLRALIFRAVAQAELGDHDFGRFTAPLRLALELARPV